MTDPPSGWRSRTRRSGEGEAVDLLQRLPRVVARSRDAVDRGASRALARASAGRRSTRRALSTRSRWQWLLAVGLVVAVALAAGVGPGAADSTEVSGCTTINSSGTYVLANDTSTTHDCLNVTASDVVIDGQNHTLTQTDVGNGTAVAVDPGVSNVTVRNLTTKGWGRGLGLDGVANATVRNVRLRGGGTGLWLRNASNAVVEDARVADNDGVAASNASGLAMDEVVLDNVSAELGLTTGPATLSNLTLRGSPGIDVQDDDVTVRDALVTDPGSDGVTVQSAARADLANVTVRNAGSEAIRIRSSSDVVVANATLTSGDGALSIEDGSSDVTVVDSDMVGNSVESTGAAVKLGSGSGVRFVRNNVSNNGAVGVQGGANDATIADTVISENEGHGLDLGQANATNQSIRNVTVVGNDGHGFFDGAGAENLTIANSTFASNAQKGIEVGSVATNTLTIEDNVVRRNGADGILVTNSEGALFRNNLVRSNVGVGIEWDDVDTVLIGNRLVNNTFGLYVTQKDNATLRNNALLNNSHAGAYFLESKSSSLNGTLLRDNGVGISVEGSPEINGTNVDVGNSTAPNTTVDFVARNVNVSGVADPAEPPAGNASIRRFVNATSFPWSTSVFDFDLHYEESDLWGVNESSLAIWRDGGGGNWSTVSGSSVNTTANVVRASASSFGEFAAFGDATGPAYRVEIDDTSSPVVEGETLRVNATVTNEGGVGGNQTVTLTTNDTERDDATLSLNASESTSITLNWTDTDGMAGDYNATVASENDTATANVTVQAPANFSVGIDSAETDVLEGENLTVTANVTNTGDVEGEQTVNLTVDGNRVANRTLTIGGGNRSVFDLNWTTTRGDNGTHTATVNTEDDSASETVTVDAYPYLDVEIVGNDSPVTEGENLTITANVTNTGDREADQVVNLSIDGDVGEVANRSVALGGGDSTEFALNWTTEVGQNGTYDATVASENDTASTSVEVLTPANFTVQHVAVDDGVLEGRNVSVSANVSNVGGTTDTQDVNLTVDDRRVANQTVRLDGDDWTNVTLNWTTTRGDNGTHSAAVNTEDDSATTSLTVDAYPYLDVEIVGNDSPVTEGQNLTVTANVTNTGDREADQVVNLSIDGGDAVDTEPVTLGGGNSTEFTLNWTTEVGQNGTYDATVASENDTASASVEVLTPANFTVQHVAVDDGVLEGRNVSVSANVSNVGGTTDTQDVNLTVDDRRVANQTVRLDGDDWTNVTLNWTTTRGDNGTHSAAVNTEDDSATTSLTVDAYPYLDVEIVGNDSPVTEGQNLTVTANVTNTGDRRADQVVNLSIDGGDAVANRSIGLDGGTWTNVTLNWSTTRGDNGTHTATVNTENASASQSVTVDALPRFDVEIVDHEPTLTAGEQLNVTANVTNLGDLNDTQTVNLSVNGTAGDVDNQSLSLPGGNSKNVTLTWNTTNATPANYTATVASENDSDARAVTVLGERSFEVSITGDDSPVTEGETLTVDANVSYRAEAEASQTIALNVSGRQDSQVVNFTEPGTEAITLEWATSSGEAGEYVAVVASENDTDSANVTVEAAGGGGGIVLPPGDDGDSVVDGGPNVRVSSVAADDPVHVGERLAVRANVTNVDDASGTDDVALVVNGTLRDVRNVTLAANETRTVELHWTPTDGDVGEHRTVVRTGADAGVRYVEVTERPTLDVSIARTNAPISAGSVLRVTARVAATGDANGTIELVAPDGRRVDAREVALAANDSRTLALAWGTRASDAGRRTVTVRGPDDAASATVELGTAPSLDVRIRSAPTRVEANETILVRATVSNAGDEPADGRAVLVVDGRERADGRLSLAGGEERTVELAWTPTAAHVGTHRLVVRAGSGRAASDVTVANASGGGIAPGLPEWTSETVDYRPTEQDAHVGGFLWLTGLLAGLGGYVLLTRRTLEGRLFGATLATAAARTATDVLHASVGGLQTGHLVGLNALLELYAGLCFLGFAGAFVDHAWLRSRRGAATLGAVAAASTVATASNPAHGLVYGDVRLASDAFTYVTADTGPLGWVLLAATVASVVLSVGLLARSFLSGRDPAWRPVGVLVAGLCLGTVAVLASAFERGPIPQYDYTGAGVAGVLLTTTTTLFGHGLHRIKQTAQKSLIEDLDDPIVIANDAHVVVEFNDAAANLLPGLAAGSRLDSLLEFGMEWPDAGETTSVERSRAELLPGRSDREPATDGAGFGRPGAEAETSGGEAPRDEAGATGADPGAAEAGREERAPGGEPGGESGVARAGESGATPGGEPGTTPGDESDGRPDEPGCRPGEASDDSAEEQHFLVQTTPVTAETGDSIGYTIRFTDVTELKRRTKALAGKNAQLEQVASTISHDLRNPMTVASGYVEQLRVTTPDPDSGEPVREPAALGEMLGHVRESLERMEDIIDDVLALARSADPVTTRPDVAFGEVVADAWATVETDVATLTLEADGRLEADRQRLQRMLENLFRNAVEHVGDGVHVTATLTEDGFAVADDGPGVPPKDREKVFDQGYTSSQQGTGLGLSIVQQLARAHDWDVALDPDADGARFVVTGCDVHVDDGEHRERAAGHDSAVGVGGETATTTDRDAAGEAVEETWDWADDGSSGSDDEPDGADESA